MNRLIVGTADHTQLLLDAAQSPFFIVDDGPIADAFLEKFPDARLLDITKHRLTLLQGIQKPDAKRIADIIYSYDPDAGATTLTVRNGRRALARLLLTADYIRKITGDKKEPATAEALGMLDEILFSDILARVFGHTPNFALSGSIVLKLDRSNLDEFEAYLLAALLIRQVQGQVIVPDFGFYGRELHTYLIRQNRLVAGVTYLAELSPKLRQAVLTIKDKHASGTTYEDAEQLAKYMRIKPNTDGFDTFVRGAMA